jgi:DNA-binding transcriptional regulator YbjK
MPTNNDSKLKTEENTLDRKQLLKENYQAQKRARARGQSVLEQWNQAMAEPAMRQLNGEAWMQAMGQRLEQIMEPIHRGQSVLEQWNQAMAEPAMRQLNGEAWMQAMGQRLEQIMEPIHREQSQMAPQPPDHSAPAPRNPPSAPTGPTGPTHGGRG